MRPRRSGFGDFVAQRRHKPDYMLVVLSAILLIIGLIVVYAISPGLAAQKNVSENYYVGKQFLAILLGVGSFVVTSQIPVNFWRRTINVLVIVAAVSAVAVRLFGEKVNGAYRWIQIGGLSFQPVELIKFVALIWLAVFLSDQIKTGLLNDFKKTTKVLLIALAIVGLVVGKVQSDLGSAAVIVAMVAATTLLAGIELKRVFIIGVVVLLGASMLIMTTSYRRDRLLTFLSPERDCLGSGYQTCQALIAVGSGGVFGKGLAHSGQAGGYLPEAANDSIFAIMSEKFGFFGVTILLVLFLALFTRMKNILERTPDMYNRLLVAGALAWLSTQAIINVGAMIGLLPLKGITLPFISYGGTSVVFVTAAVGLVFNISRYTTFRVSVEGEATRHESATDWRRNRRPYYAAADRRS